MLEGFDFSLDKNKFIVGLWLEPSKMFSVHYRLGDSDSYYHSKERFDHKVGTLMGVYFQNFCLGENMAIFDFVELLSMFANNQLSIKRAHGYEFVGWIAYAAQVKDETFLQISIRELDEEGEGYPLHYIDRLTARIMHAKLQRILKEFQFACQSGYGG